MSIRFLPAALIAVFIALVAVGGAALAFGIGGADSERTDDLLERAATDLGVDAQTLKDALSQARSELTTEHQQEVLAKLVEDEVITQDQANEASIWLDQKPDAVNKLLRPELLLNLAAGAGRTFPFGDSEILSLRIPGMFLGDDPDLVTEKMAEILDIDAATLDEALKSARQDQAADERANEINDVIDNLVEDGEITLAEGDAIKTWIGTMPEWLNNPGLLFKIFSTGFSTSLGSHDFGGSRFLREFGRGFDHDPLRAVPELHELREGRFPFFPGPDARPFEIPGFEFRSLDDGEPEERFFFRVPEGEFHFDGEIPPEFEDPFKDLEQRFGDQFGFGSPFEHGDLDDLFKRLPGYRVDPAPEQPEDTDDSVNNEKGA